MRGAGNSAFFHNQRLKLVLVCQLQMLSHSFQSNFNHNSAMNVDTTECMKYLKQVREKNNIKRDSRLLLRGTPPGIWNFQNEKCVTVFLLVNFEMIFNNSARNTCLCYPSYAWRVT